MATEISPDERVLSALLRLSETSAQLAIEAAGLGRWEYDAIGGELTLDARCRTLLGLEADADVSHEFVLSHCDITHRTRVASALTGAMSPERKGKVAEECRIIHGFSGTERWVSIAGRGFFENGQCTRFLAMVADITDRKNSEAALHELTGGVAHDFNNLLQVVVGNLETLQRNLPPDLERLRRAADHAMTGARRAANLTQRLLAFSRRQPLNPKPIAVNKLVARMSEMLVRTLGESIEVRTRLDPGLWPVEVDENQLESALLNLAVNARDAMPRGGELAIETCNVRIDAEKPLRSDLHPGDYILLRVLDTGSGMPADVLARAFEPFFTTKSVGQGTGLGLSQVYGFVKQSGGVVELDSTPDIGTSISIYLPRLDREIELSAGEPLSRAMRSLPHETILVVEDDPDVRAYTAETLRELGYHVLEARDGHTALRELQQTMNGNIDLLFTDVVLPGGLNGQQLARRAQELKPHLKVLFATGYARDVIVHHGRLDPGVQLIIKPFSLEDLAAKIRGVLETPAEKELH